MASRSLEPFRKWEHVLKDAPGSLSKPAGAFAAFVEKHGIDPKLAQKADQATLERVLITKGTKYTIGDCMRLRELLQRTEIEVCPLAKMEQKKGGAVSSSWSHRWLRVVQVQRGDRVVLELQTSVDEHGELQNSREILPDLQDRVATGISDDRGKGKREHRFDMSVATTAEDASTTLSLNAQSGDAKKDWLRRLAPFCLLSPGSRATFVSGGVGAAGPADAGGMRCQTDEEKTTEKKLGVNALKHVKCVFDLVDDNCDEVLNESEFREALKRLAPKHQRTLDNQALLQKIKMADTDGDELLNYDELLKVINDDSDICKEIEKHLKGKSIIDAAKVMEKIKSTQYQPTFYVSIKIFSIREIDDKHHTFHANFKINIDWEDKDELPYELGQGPSCKCWPKLKILNQVDVSSMECAPDKCALKKETGGDGKSWWCLEKEFDGVFKSEKWDLVRVCRRAQPRCCAVSRMLAAYPPAPSPCVWIGAQPRTNFRSTTRNWRCR